MQLCDAVFISRACMLLQREREILEKVREIGDEEGSRVVQEVTRRLPAPKISQEPQVRGYPAARVACMHFSSAPMLCKSLSCLGMHVQLYAVPCDSHPHALSTRFNKWSACASTSADGWGFCLRLLGDKGEHLLDPERRGRWPCWRAQTDAAPSGGHPV